MIALWKRAIKNFHFSLLAVFWLFFSSIIISGCSSAGIPDTGLGGLYEAAAPVPLEEQFRQPLRTSIVSPTTHPVEAVSPTVTVAAQSEREAPGPQPYPNPDGAFSGSPAPTPSPEPRPITEPSATSIPTPEPTPFPLTHRGCCPHPFWSSDSAYIYFIGSPFPGSEAGLWRIALEGSDPEFITPAVGVFSRDVSLAAFPLKGQTFIENLETAEIWLVPNGGRKVYFSPDGAQIAWTAWEHIQGKRFLRPIWVSEVDGTQAGEVIALFGLGFTDWFPDGRLLVHGRFDYDEEFNSYWAVSPEDGSLIELARGFRLSYGSISPGSRWMAYHNVLDPRQDENGLWVVDTKTLERKKLDVFGPFQWRSEGRLVVVPLDIDSALHRLTEIDIESGIATSFVDPEAAHLKIAGGDWALSPDGRWLAYVSAEDYNIWVLKLP